MLVTILLSVALLMYGAWVAHRAWKNRGKCHCGCEGCAFSSSCHQNK